MGSQKNVSLQTSIISRNLDVSSCFFVSLSLKSFKSQSQILNQGTRRLEATHYMYSSPLKFLGNDVNSGERKTITNQHTMVLVPCENTKPRKQRLRS